MIKLFVQGNHHLLVDLYLTSFTGELIAANDPLIYYIWLISSFSLLKISKKLSNLFFTDSKFTNLIYLADLTLVKVFSFIYFLGYNFSILLFIYDFIS